MIRDWEAHTLARCERRVVLALAGALYDPEGEATHAHELGFTALADDVGRWLGATSGATRALLRGLLAALEVSPVRFGHGPRALSKLSPRERVRYLASLDAKSSLALDVWKSVLGMAHFGGARGAERTRVPAPITRLVRRAQAQARQPDAPDALRPPREARTHGRRAS